MQVKPFVGTQGHWEPMIISGQYFRGDIGQVSHSVIWVFLRTVASRCGIYECQ